LRGYRVVGIGGVDQRGDILGQRHREILGDPAQLIEPLRRHQAALSQIV
jgi:hypothetical protein